MLTKKEKLIDEFLKDVDDQIAYQPMHSAINEELKAHIEDKAEMYMDFGLNEDVSLEKAIRDMGDAYALGIQLNETHRLRTAKPLLILIMALVGLGWIGNIIDDGLFGIFDSAYYVIGLGILGLIFYRGYPVMLQYAERILKILLASMILWVILLALQRRWDIPIMSHALLRLYSPSVLFGIFQLSSPMLSVFLYRRRKKPWTSLGIMFAYQAVMILISRISYVGEYSYIPYLTMIISTVSISAYMIYKRYLNVEIKKGFIFIFAGTILLLWTFCALQWKDVSRNIQMFINPNARASVTSSWDDSYNNVLIRELLSKAEPIGKIELSKEELVRYGTAQWYYEDGEGTWNGNTSPNENFEDEIAYRMQFLDDPEIEDVMPNHYHNNLRIALWILKYGWIPALAILGLIIATQVVIFQTSWKIHNRLGRIVAIAGSITLAVQNIFYICGNFGFQFGKFGNLPFVSEGLVSIAGTMTMAGIILSAYRFDTVVKEEMGR